MVSMMAYRTTENIGCENGIDQRLGEHADERNISIRFTFCIVLVHKVVIIGCIDLLLGEDK